MCAMYLLLNDYNPYITYIMGKTALSMYIYITYLSSRIAREISESEDRLTITFYLVILFVILILLLYLHLNNGGI